MSHEDQAIIRHITNLAHDLGMITIVEGVETEEQASLLFTLGVDLAQGFLFGRPEPAAQIDALLDPVDPSAVFGAGEPTSRRPRWADRSRPGPDPTAPRPAPAAAQLPGLPDPRHPRAAAPGLTGRRTVAGRPAVRRRPSWWPRLVWAAYSPPQGDRRDAQIPAVAAAKGLQLRQRRPVRLERCWPSPCSTRATGRASRTSSGARPTPAPDGTQARVFDFGWYKVHHDRSGATYEEWHWSTCALAQPNGAWPPLEVQRRAADGPGPRAGRRRPHPLRVRGVQRTFHVTCEDRRFASALIDPQMMQFLLETKGLVSFATVGPLRAGGQPPGGPDEMPILLGLADEFVRAHPGRGVGAVPAAGAGDRSTADRGGRSPEPGAAAAAAPWRPSERRPRDAWDPTPGVDYDLDGHPVGAHDRRSVARPPTPTPRPAATGSHRVRPAP